MAAKLKRKNYTKINWRLAVTIAKWLKIKMINVK